ncbi:MAG: acetate--CoA ligase family protein [Pseudomonadota bacterium]
MTDLSRLLRPRSIAVIGGSWARAVVEQCRFMGFDGPVWPVHPTREELAGVPCFRTIEDLPCAPDATFIGINRQATIEAVQALAAGGAGGAVCFASGFAEAADDPEGGRALQADLLRAAGDMPILGPNCYGLINYLDGALLWPDQHGGRRVERGVAILGQSSNVLINLTMQRRGLPLAYVMAAGNQAQVGLADMAAALLDDPRVTAIGLHIEGISDIRAFEAMATKARAVGKPVVALKIGRSEAAQKAALSHTASLAGGDAASRAFLARVGVPVLNSLSEFLQSLMLAHVHGALAGRDLCSISCSGGEASLMADAAEGRRIQFRPLTTDQHNQVKDTLSDLVTVANPLDYHTFIWGDVPRMTATYAAMLRAGFDLSILVYDFPRTDRCDDTAWECGIEALIAATRETGARTAMLASLPENLPEDRIETLLAHGIAPLCGIDDGLAAIEAMADQYAYWQVAAPDPLLLAGGPVAESTEALDEAAAKAALAALGLNIPQGRRARGAEDAASAGVELGFPVALKGLGIAHKTEVGAVRLGLSSASAIKAAAEEMPTEDLWVEQMVADSVAELIVGVTRDPVYGYTLTIGAGGILTELLGDSVTLLIPSSVDAVREAIGGLRIARLLNGYRGKPAADLDAVVQAIMAVQAYAVQEAGRLVELDVNPLLATPTGAVAADALIVLDT